MRKCPYCKADIEETAKYCYFCMHDLESKTVIETNPPYTYKRTIVLLCTIFIIIFALFALLFIKFLLPPSKNSNKNNSPNNEIIKIYNNSYSQIQNNENNQNNQTNININQLPSINTSGNTTDDSKEPESETSAIDNQNNDDGKTETPPPVCTHSWQEITGTITDLKNVTYYKCPICYEKFKSVNLYYSHFDSNCGLSFNAYILRERYETVNEFENYDKTIITGYKCTHCGETKAVTE